MADEYDGPGAALLRTSAGGKGRAELAGLRVTSSGGKERVRCTSGGGNCLVFVGCTLVGGARVLFCCEDIFPFTADLLDCGCGCCCCGDGAGLYDADDEEGEADVAVAVAATGRMALRFAPPPNEGPGAAPPLSGRLLLLVWMPLGPLPLATGSAPLR